MSRAEFLDNERPGAPPLGFHSSADGSNRCDRCHLHADQCSCRRDDGEPLGGFELTEPPLLSADLEVEIPGAGMIQRANITPLRAVLVIAGRVAGGGVLHEVREPEEMRAAARVLTLAAQEMETLRAARADVRNRERRYQPGRIQS